MEQNRPAPMAGGTVLVTGGSDVIGKATALGLAAMGAHLAITGRDLGRTEDAARDIRAAGRRQVDVFVADLSCQSGYMPNLLGVLAGLGYVFDSIGRVLSGGSSPNVSAVTFIGEFVLALWLVIWGRHITLSESGSHLRLFPHSPGDTGTATTLSP